MSNTLQLQQNTKTASAVTSTTNVNVKNIIKHAPIDVIRHFVFPSLDYESRIELNRCLDPCDRISTKMSAEALDSHDRHICYHTLFMLLNKTRTIDHPDIIIKTTKLHKLTIKIFSLFQKPNYLNFISSEIKLREVIFLKIQEFSESIQRDNGIDISLKERLGRAIKAARIKIEKTPICQKIPVSPILI